MTKQEILDLVDKENIHFFRLQFIDIFGFMKNVAIPRSQIEKALDGKMMFDGSSIDGFVRINESDMYLKPDYGTFVVLPWRHLDGRGAARIICDVYKSDGKTPFEGCPRVNLKRVLGEAEKLGYTMNVGPECEFFLFRYDENGRPTTVTQDVAGYFDVDPADEGIACRREIIETLEQMGFEIEASHHEVAEGQHEINFKYADAITCADNTVTYKWVVKTIAKKYGLHATFMPKPVFGINGSGMHTNQSLFTLDGKNAFLDESADLELSDVARQYIAGIMKHARSFAAVTNPLVNSYKRLVAGYEAPVYVAWSASNRSASTRANMSLLASISSGVSSPRSPTASARSNIIGMALSISVTATPSISSWRRPEANSAPVTAPSVLAKAMRIGATDYLLKPFKPDQISLVMERISVQKRLVSQYNYLKGRLEKITRFDNIIGQAPAMEAVFSLIPEVAQSDSSILLFGETGTGKELVAKAIHAESRRSHLPFIAINCGAIPESLLESELFGHQKGVFTGATRARKGFLEVVSGGTLFLDEIGEISSKMQIDLLRVLEEKKITSIGSREPVDVDFRLVSATRQDLKKEAAEGNFREDFFYRINVIMIEIPPLRKRKEDISLLVEHFLIKYSQETSKKVDHVTSNAMGLLKQYDWPGNVRELENAIERAVVLSKSRTLRPEDFSFIQPSGIQFSESLSLREMEKEYIQKILEENTWNVTQSAKILGINRVTLHKMIKRYNLKRTP